MKKPGMIASGAAIILAKMKSSPFKRTGRELLQEWNRRIPREDKSLTRKDNVCAKHFYKDDIITHDSFLMPDGSIHLHERGTAKLKDGAVPKIFDGPNTPGYLTVKQTKKRNPKERSLSVPPKKKTKVKCTTDKSKINATAVSTNAPVSVEPHQDKETPNPQDVIAESSDAPNQPEISNNNLKIPPNPEKTINEFCHKIKLPGAMWGIHVREGESIVLSHINDSFDVDKVIEFKNSMKPNVFFLKKPVDMPEITSTEDLQNLINKVHYTRLCPGHTDLGMRNPCWASTCSGFLPLGSTLKKVRCQSCIKVRKSAHKNKKGKKNGSLEKKKCMRRHQQKVRRLGKRLQTLQDEVRALRNEMKQISDKAAEDLITSLPGEQQELVKACIQASKCHIKGRRYTIKWVYECLLMKIQSPRLYRRLREQNKLPLPSQITLGRYVKKLRPIYGFQENTFKIMKEKAENMPIGERHGCLLLDEMGLDSSLCFKRDSLEVQGLVDLGKYTPKEEQEKRGDHALVLMYQPFKGQWVQVIAAFLSSGAVPGSILKQIILEAILLLHRHGFHTDCVTTDGASWNRQMWDLFGVNKEKFYCEHPMDPKHKLFFASDFPHLIKNLWARIVNKKELHLPEGVVKLSHWRSVVETEKKRGIRRAFTITADFLDPTNYQKMNVPMAMRFFGHTVGTAMESFRNENVPGLEDSLPTVKFINRINKVVEAMNSQLPVEGLRKERTSTNQIVLREFLDYLQTMEEMAQNRLMKEEAEKKRATEEIKKYKQQKADQGRMASGAPPKRPYNKKPRNADAAECVPNKLKISVGTGAGDHEFTTSTFFGLWVTVQTALGLVDYLTDELQYYYLLTRRINQDALEHFFGLIRGACGSNTHPDPNLFIQVFKLLSTYSLVKPPRGSNVSGADLLETLTELKDVVGEQNQARRAEMEAKIDLLLDGGIPDMEEGAHMQDHDYLDYSIDVGALTVFAGYVSRKMRKMKPASECSICFQAVCAPATHEKEERENFLDLKSYGGYLRPSTELFEVVFEMEQAISKVTSKAPVHKNLLFHVLDTLLVFSTITMLGCDEHERLLTSSLITFYLTCRMHFVCRDADQLVADAKRKKRNMAKLAKLVKDTQND